MSKEIAERWYQQAEIVQRFLIRVVEPYLAKPTVLDQTIEGLHLRSRYWLDSMLRLNSVFDFQAIMAGARASIETAVDVTLLLVDTDGSKLAAMHAWEDSAKLHAAEKAIAFAVKSGAAPRSDLTGFVAARKVAIDADRIARGWARTTKTGAVKPRHPNRWTGKDFGSDCDEAERLIDPELRSVWLSGISLVASYAEWYTFMCWNTHASALLPLRGSDPRVMFDYCGVGFAHIQQVAMYTGGGVLKHHGKLGEHEADAMAFHRERVGHLRPGWKPGDPEP